MATRAPLCRFLRCGRDPCCAVNKDILVRSLLIVVTPCAPVETGIGVENESLRSRELRRSARERSVVGVQCVRIRGSMPTALATA